MIKPDRCKAINKSVKSIKSCSNAQMTPSATKFIISALAIDMSSTTGVTPDWVRVVSKGSRSGINSDTIMSSIPSRR